MTDEQYLREDVFIEPLVDQWYAWSYLVPPVTAALYVANAHVRLLESFVESPHAHVRARLDAAMRGGPVVGLDLEDVEAARALLARTKRRCASSLELADAVARLEALLGAEANGFSLEPLYQRVPEALRGYVELTYDLSNRASARYLEALVYRGRYWDERRQGAVLAAPGARARGFAFSTPRLSRPGEVMVRRPFRAPAFDALYRARHSACEVDPLAAALGIGPADRAAFDALFTARPPRRTRPYTGAAPRLRYFGHASVLVEAGGVSVLTDPVPCTGSGDGRFTTADLPDIIDCVLITHNHQDHCMLEPLLELRHRVRRVVIPRGGGGSLADPSLPLTLRHLGFPHVVELGELESLALGPGTITAIPFFGEHGDLDVRTKAGYYVELAGRGTLFLADSNNLEPRLYEHVGTCVGRVDAMFVGMECEGAPMNWLYGPLFSRPLDRALAQSRRLDGSDAEKAIDLVRRFAPSRVYVYAMGQEPWLAHVMSVDYSPSSPPIVESDKLVAYCRERGVEAERLYGTKEITLD